MHGGSAPETRNCAKWRIDVYQSAHRRHRKYRLAIEPAENMSRHLSVLLRVYGAREGANGHAHAFRARTGGEMSCRAVISAP